MPAKTPQDRKPKGDRYQFTATVDGKPKTFTLPSAAEASTKVSGRFLRDAAMKGEEGQIALGFATLEAAGATEAAIDALYDMPAPEMLEHIGAWMQFKASPEDASLGESSGSSS